MKDNVNVRGTWRRASNVEKCWITLRTWGLRSYGDLPTTSTIACWRRCDNATWRGVADGETSVLDKELVVINTRRQNSVEVQGDDGGVNREGSAGTPGVSADAGGIVNATAVKEARAGKHSDDRRPEFLESARRILHE